MTFEHLQNVVQPHTIVSGENLKMIYEMSRHSSTLEGDMAEVGVYKGGTSLLLALANEHKVIHSYDTFEGIPETTAVDGHEIGDFTLQGEVPKILTEQPNIKVHKGMFPGTSRFSDKFCFAHYDGDTYQTCCSFIGYFLPRIAIGGAMLFDDYKWHRCPGVEKALLQFFDPLRIIHTGGNQAMIIVT
jgi:O-methyltransferase